MLSVKITRVLSYLGLDPDVQVNLIWGRNCSLDPGLGKKEGRIRFLVFAFYVRNKASP